MTSTAQFTTSNVIIDADEPVLLQPDGTACRDIQLVVQETSLEQHKATNPSAWTQWKMLDGKVVLLVDGSWVAPTSQVLYPPNNRGTMLGDSTYESIRPSSSNTRQVIDFEADSYSSNTYEWSIPDGGITWPLGQSMGEYEVDGYTLALTDSTRRVVPLVYSAQNPERIFVDDKVMQRRAR